MRALRSAAFLSVTLVALATAGSATADVEIGALPGGTSISVAINTPADGAVVQLGDPVPVSGTAAVATGVILKDTTVVYVVDRSGSMSLSAGVDCNGIAGADTRLVCVQEAIGVANGAAAAASSSVDLTGLGSFAGADDPDGVAHDVDLGTAGTQLLVTPALDGNGNTTPDVEDVANGLVAGGGTCYSCGLEAAIDILTSPANTNAANIVIFLSDGFNGGGANVSTVTGFPAGTIIHSFALGDPAVVNCSAPAAAGNLDAVAALTPGGTCQQTEDFADVGDVISEAIGSTLSTLTFTVDAVPRPIVVVPALPQSGPAAVAFSTTLLGLSAGPHTLVARATGSDAGGAGSISDTHTIFVNTPPSCVGATAGGPIWPPNHKFVARSITGVTDADGDPVTVTITGITQDEPLNGVADGNTSPDAVIGSGGSFRVRAERAGTGDGRVYRISFTGADDAGGVCSGVVRIGVPHDQSGAPPVDSGSIFVST